MGSILSRGICLEQRRWHVQGMEKSPMCSHGTVGMLGRYERGAEAWEEVLDRREFYPRRHLLRTRRGAALLDSSFGIQPPAGIRAVLVVIRMCTGEEGLENSEEPRRFELSLVISHFQIPGLFVPLSQLAVLACPVPSHPWLPRFPMSSSLGILNPFSKNSM